MQGCLVFRGFSWVILLIFVLVAVGFLVSMMVEVASRSDVML